MISPQEKELKREISNKEQALERVERVLRQRTFVALISVPFLVFLQKFSHFFSPPLLVLFTIIIFGIFPVGYFIKKKKEALTANNICLLLALTFTIELICVLTIFYLLIPLLIYYFGNLLLSMVFVLTLFVIVSNPVFNNRKYSYFFFILSCLALLVFGVFDYYRVRQLDRIVFSLVISFMFISVVQFYLDNFWNMFRRQTEELEELNEKLEQRVMERTRELEEAKTALEIKVKARTKELEELAENLEAQVKERTKQLQKRVSELESFQKLTVGREVKMVELKKETEKLKKELGKHKPSI